MDTFIRIIIKPFLKALIIIFCVVFFIGIFNFISLMGTNLDSSSSLMTIGIGLAGFIHFCVIYVITKAALLYTEKKEEKKRGVIAAPPPPTQLRQGNSLFDGLSKLF